ncbi:MAG: bifunctional folylpolyglutamate synthase/dihydrofolate synthase [Bacteroidales bacterium]|nr:bifunctional folylpolyglutamate synthase/dihydrofolate synthase [Bacteroidales bacterium]
MNYSECIQYLYAQLPQFQVIGAGAYKPGLQNVEALDAWCGHPHEAFPCVHVAGTNGKGSVSNLLASVLQEAGYKVGLFTSPHLKDFRERIRVNGQMISQEDVCRFTESYIEAKLEVQPSFFELTTMMAFQYFAQQQVDIAIIEVGLGGRLDSTNIIRPILSVITSISFDHVALLGDTLPQIAKEKAGIIKPGVPVVVAENPEEVLEVVRAQARERKSPICENLEDNRFKKLQGIDCALKGYYTAENARTVLMALDILAETFFINEDIIRRAFVNVLKNTGLRGRWEVLQEKPLCICDTGHNEAGIRYIVKQLLDTPHRRLHMVIGVVSDKDVDHILALLPKDALYYFTKASIPRALPEDELAEKAAAYALKGSTYPTVLQAKEAALQAASDDDLVFVGGSNFVVAEIL